MSLSVENLTVKTKKQTILKNISFSLKYGDSLSIIGPSGSGKTTLIKTLLNLLSPDLTTSGSIRVNDQHLHEGDQKISSRLPRQCGYIPQNLALWPHLNVKHTLSLALRFSKKDQKFSFLEKDLIELCGLKGQEEKNSSALSGGEGQRLALARALAQQPKILILDEPFSALDVVAKGQLIDLLQRFKNIFSFTSLFISHDIKEALILGEKIMILKEGLLIWFGDSSKIKDAPFPAEWNPFTSQVFSSLEAMTDNSDTIAR